MPFPFESSSIFPEIYGKEIDKYTKVMCKKITVIRTEGMSE